MNVYVRSSREMGVSLAGLESVHKDIREPRCVISISFQKNSVPTEILRKRLRWEERCSTENNKIAVSWTSLKPGILKYLSSYLFLNNFIYLFNFWLCWVFILLCKLSRIVMSRGYSSLWCEGFSLSWHLLLQSKNSRRTGFSSCRLSCSMAYGIFPDQGWNPCPPALTGGLLFTWWIFTHFLGSTKEVQYLLEIIIEPG